MRRLLCLSLLSSLALVGCGGTDEGADKRRFADVSGTVVSKGQPLTTPDGITLMFSDGSRPVPVEVDTDGTFEGSVVVGENTVTVAQPAGAHAGSGEVIEGVDPAVMMGASGGKPVTVTIPEGGAEDLKIEVGGGSE